MLRLERLEISGFKSFPEKTQVEFPDGVTAVVGPNGCGKSNVVDAVQWALGEQSARALRGARMEDVIFAGSSERGPGGMAEVTLHLVSRNGTELLGEGRARVTMTRRLFRSGESEYLVDGRKARLQDIRAILEKIRAGARTYAVIDQARVAAFVVSKPRDRRAFIEEAAGISGYKQRRRLSELKLEATEANLLRVEDIVRELERQRRSLQRQASMARRARRLDEEYGGLRSMWYARRYRSLAARREHLEELLGVARRETLHLDRERERLERVLAQARTAVEASQRRRDGIIERIHAGELETSRLEAERTAAIDRARGLREEAERREGERRLLEEDRASRATMISGLEGDVERLLSRRREHDARLEQARQEAEQARQAHRSAREQAVAAERDLYVKLHARADLQAQLTSAQAAAERERARTAELAETRRELEQALARARGEIARASGIHAREQERASRLESDRRALQEREQQAREALDAARSLERALAAELGEKTGEKAALDALETRLFGAEGARELIERAGEAGFVAERVLAEVIEADPEVESAAEAFLAEWLAAVLVPSLDDVRAGAALGLSGRAALAPLELLGAAPVEPRAELPDAARRDPRVRGRLSERLRPRPGVEPVILERLADAVLVENLDAALDLHRRYPGWHFLTPEGDLVREDGLVVLAGNGGEAAGRREGLLARARRREQLEREVGRLELRRRESHEVLAGARDELQRIEQERRAVEEELEQARRGVATAQMAREQAAREVERIEQELRANGARLERTEQDGREHEAAISRYAHACSEADVALEAQRRALDEARAAAHRGEERVRDHVSTLARLETERNALDERLEAVRRELERVREEISTLESRGAEGERARSAALDEARGLDRLAAGARARLEALAAELDRLRATRRSAEEELEASIERQHELEARVALVAEELETARGRRERAALEAERAESDLAHVCEGCLEEIGRAPEELSCEPPEGANPGLIEDEQRLAEHLGELRRKRARLGPVNLLAESEFEELSRRWEEMTTQRDDLRTSIEELRASIRRMNRESRERFLDAFHAIRRHFREQFAILFRGGTADLRLEDEDEPLESGIEIVCQPPGKKLQAVTLLSGGEKALAATAVLFAIFRYHPPPFCLLDEVDAPLDDANIGRFAEALRNFADRTQFIVITHNKRTMELADLLYGVTMPEPGVSRLVSMNLD